MNDLVCVSLISMLLFVAIGVEEERQQAACLHFDGPHLFDLNFPPNDLQQQMPGKLTISYPFPF